jgi:anti-anti-sigma factor
MSAAVIKVEGELSIYRAAELKPVLLAWPTEGAIEIDLAEVSEIDSAGVQLLLLVQREAAAVQRELRLLDPSPAVVEVLTLLGLHSLLAQPALAA